MTSDRPLGAVALNHNRVALPASLVTDDTRLLSLDRLADTTDAVAARAPPGGDIAVQPPADATLSRASHRPTASPMSATDASALPFAPPSAGAAALMAASAAAAAAASFPASLPRQLSADGDDRSSQSHPRSTTGSQDTTMTTSTDPVFTPPASESGACPPVSSQESQLLHLSQIAAAQDKMATDSWSSRKRMADGVVKTRSDSQSPVKGHSRNTSAVSRISTGSYIGEVGRPCCCRGREGCNGKGSRCRRRPSLAEHPQTTNTLQLSTELRTRLSYAMVKVNHGWQSNSLEEVESLASHAASPTSSTSTVHRRHGSSASPRLAISSAPTASAPSLYEPVAQLRRSNSPPRTSTGKPGLGPPASIQPSMSMPAPRSNPRRNSNPHYTPTLLSHSHSASPHTPAQPTVQTGSRSRNIADPILFSPHQNVREQDAIESLLFMSSPGNSANLKHAFSPTGSPGPHLGVTRPVPTRHALPSGPRKPLPSSQRQQYQSKRPGFEKSPGMPPPPGSPMELDSPQQPYHTPNRGTPRRRINGGSSHLRGALSLPSGLGVGNGTARKMLRDEDIERMLDRAGAETGDSSDDEEIQIPQPRSGVAGVMQV
ncbi:hypothetical protein AK830_g8509 [Neonectria ditissima]|uniref:Uncharacterized protein n=1 Tax=Neonectria ditissima TaxID=78410 RepID=A0A0P7B7X7_9HYPO|nr:hypothetical protein AK830_g8509 [Neonectria ditissima]